MNIKETKKRGKFRRFGAFVLALSMIFGSSTPAIAVAAPTPTAVEERVEKSAATPAETPKEAPAKTEVTPAKPEETAPAEKQQAPAKTGAEKHAEEAAETPAKPEETAPEEKKTPAPEETQANELEISPEDVPEGVGRGGIPAPGINKVFYGATSVSGTNLHRAKVGGKTVRATVHVTVTDKNGNEKANVSVAPKSGSGWSVNLPANVEIAEGDTVVAYQELDGVKSPTATATAQPSLANQITLTMPTGEIWIEQTSSNQVNEDEQKEAVEKFNAVNTAIAGDIKSVNFSIDGVNHAYYEVTYTDGSTSGKVEAPNLKIKQVTEYSRGATLDTITVVDNKITGQLAGEGPFDGIKVQIVTKVSDADKETYCKEGKCKVDKDSAKEVDAKVDSATGKFSYTWGGATLPLDQIVGVIVKEKNKFKSCSTSTVKPVTVPPTEVRDPRKLTDADKAAIEQTIRKAYTGADHTSKLPDGTGEHEGIPAPIVFNEDGSVSIFSGNDVEVKKWDDDGKPIPEKNSDGTNKLQDGAKSVVTILAKDLVKNIAPKSPSIAVDTDTGKVTVTPPAYKDPGDDTDLLSYTLTYKDASGAEKTVTATRDLETNKWSGEGVNEDGTITLDVNKLEVGGTLTATAKDNGGLEGDTDKLDSDPATKKLETATVSYNFGQSEEGTPGEGNMVGKTVNQGSKYKLLDNAFTLKYHKFKAWEVNGKEVAAGTEITVTKDTVVKALWERLKVNVTYEPGDGGKGEMTKNPEKVDMGSDYTVRPPEFKPSDPDQAFEKWTTTVGELAGKDLTAPFNTYTFKILEDTVFTAHWKDIMVDVIYQPGDHGTATGKEEKDPVKRNKKDYKLKANPFQPASDEYEFIGWIIDGQGDLLKEGATINVGTGKTLVAQWQLKNRTVSFVPGKGSGEMSPITAKVNEKIQLPESTFTPPDENMEFSHWVIDEDTSGKTYKADDSFTVTANTTFKAIWKKIQVTVSYNGNGGSGDMAGATVDKGSKYTLLENTFTAPDDTQEFKAWSVNGQEVPAGTEITVDKDTEITAVWKKIQVKVSYNANGGKGTMEGKTVDKGSKYTLLPNAFLPADDTYEFEKWEIDGQPYGPKAEITVTKDTEVKAIWKKIQVTVSFDGNGGGGNMESKTVDKRGTYTLPENGFNVPNSNRMFDAWEVGGERKAPGDTITVVEDTVVKALWKKIPATITFNGNNGTGNMSPVETFKGEEYTLPKNGFTAPENKEFEGWQVGGQNKAPGDKITIEGNTEVTAIWKDSAFTVTYEPGLVGSGTKAPVQVLKKAPTHELAAANTFRPYDGFEFAGWEIDGKSYEPGYQYTVTKNTTVTAKWRPKTIQLTFVSGVGSDDKNIEKRTTQGGSYYLPSSEFKPNEGYQFRGWEINGVEKKIGDSVNTDHDVTITALWDKLVKIHYDANGGDWSGLRNKTESVPENKPFQLSYAPKRDGYVFDGWQAQGERKMYARATHPGTATEMTFVAQWRERGTSGGSGNTPGTPPVTPGTEPGTPSMPSDGGIPDRDALLRRLKSLWNSSEMRRLLEESAKKGQNGTAIPRAGVGTAERTVSTVLFPVDLMPAKKREDD